MRPVLLVLFVSLLVGCEARSGASGEAGVPVDAAYLTDARWNDGRAEVAFYRAERAQNPYGEAEEQRFLVGTYLVKHDFSPQAMTKATEAVEGGVSAFKYALFYELESGSYQYKRSYVTNAAQATLQPIKTSFTSFDWCANQYRELAFQPGGTVDYLMRSDDYGNAARSFDYRAGAYPPAQLPLLVRGLDFSEAEEIAFRVVLPGEEHYVGARVRRAGADTLALPGGPTPAERLVVTYEAPVPSVVAEEADLEETYWRGTGPERLLLRIEGASGRYRMTLVEHLRTAYWEENLWPRLQRVDERP